jgi:SAM-dependent methyltransferase
MLDWSSEKIEYYKRAAAHTKFFDKLLALLLPLFSADDDVADMGCGLGLFDLLLSPYVRHIDAIDENQSVIDNLRSEIEVRGINNIDTEIALVSDVIKPAWDIIFMSFFGNEGDMLTALLGKARKRVITVAHNDDKSRSDRGNLSRRRLSNATSIARYFEITGVEYHRFDYLLDFGQPFETMDDAEHFVNIYLPPELDEATRKMKFKATLTDLIEISESGYNYFLPKEKNISVFVVSSTFKNETKTTIA